MEKRLASHDLSDMIMYESMEAHSRRYTIKLAFAPVRKLIDQSFNALSALRRSFKRAFTSDKTAHNEPDIFIANTAVAVYSIMAASLLITFFWLSLLIAT